MPLISCPECNTQVSSKAPACPQCGAPVEAIQKKNSPGAKTLRGCAGVIFLVAALVFVAALTTEWWYGPPASTTENAAVSAQIARKDLLAHRAKADRGPKPMGHVYPTRYANIRSGPSTASSVVRQVHIGVKIPYESTKNGWFKVFEAPEEEWIHESVISSSSPSASARSSPAKSSLPTGQYRIAGANQFGCVDKGDFNDLVGYASSGDRAAFNSALGAGIATGRCTMFESGEIVFLEKLGFTTIRIRRKGETTKYWTVTEAISK